MSKKISCGNAELQLLTERSSCSPLALALLVLSAAEASAAEGSVAEGSEVEMVTK